MKITRGKLISCLCSNKKIKANQTLNQDDDEADDDSSSKTDDSNGSKVNLYANETNDQNKKTEEQAQEEDGEVVGKEMSTPNFLESLLTNNGDNLKKGSP